MRWLLFLSRLAFICGFFFLLSISLLIKDWIKDESAVSTIITLGYFMGMIIVPVTCICYLMVFIVKKKLKGIVPLWLVAANILFLLSLFVYLFFINEHIVDNIPTGG